MGNLGGENSSHFYLRGSTEVCSARRFCLRGERLILERGLPYLRTHFRGQWVCPKYRTFITFKEHLSHFVEHSSLSKSISHMLWTFVCFYNVPFKVWTQLHRTDTNMPNSLWHSSRCKWLCLKSTYATMVCQTRLVRYAEHSSLLNRRLVKCAHSYTNMHNLLQMICDIRHVHYVPGHGFPLPAIGTI